MIWRNDIDILMFSPIRNSLWVSRSARWYVYRDTKYKYYLTDRCENKVRMFNGYYEMYQWLIEIEGATPKFRQEIKECIPQS